MNNLIDMDAYKKEVDYCETEFMKASKKVPYLEGCNVCPLLALAEPTDNLINEMRAAIDRANKALPILNLAIKERDLEITKLNNALNRHAMSALRNIH